MCNSICSFQKDHLLPYQLPFTANLSRDGRNVHDAAIATPQHQGPQRHTSLHQRIQAIQKRIQLR